MTILSGRAMKNSALFLIPVHPRSIPLHVPFSVHLLTVEPVALNPSSQEDLHSVSYNFSVVLVLQPKNTPLVGNGNVGHVTAKKETKCLRDG